MCGICGMFNLDNKRKILPDVIARMMKAIKHRGPDGSNAVFTEGIAFGFVRLSFLDLTGGMQPITNEDGKILMICNGEIFNYTELRSELKEKGHVFRTKTDVEVIPHLYEEYGENFVNRLNGQFAIALYDGNNRQLRLYRDQIGIAPLFYTFFDGRLIFASEIKAILQYPGIPRKLNLHAVDQLLHFPGVVSPTTFFAGIRSLESGHMLCIDEDGLSRDEEYWDICYQQESEDKGEEYYREGLRTRILEAIQKRLIADVPIGFYISGGLDSSITACMIDRYISHTHASFSAEIKADGYAEDQFQKIIRDYIHSDHHAVSVTEDDLWNYMPEVVYYTETAVRESYDVAAYLLSGLVCQTPVKAVLTGQGADEFFNGYIGYFSDSFRQMQKGKMNLRECEINERLWGDPYFRYERRHDELQDYHRKLYNSTLASEMDQFSAIEHSPICLNKVKGLGTQRRRSYIDAKLRLADHLLGDHGDRMVFAHSIEGRHPFCDINVVQFALDMPEKYKLRGANEKYILKKIAEGIVPDEIIRRKKFPFQTPGMAQMLKQDNPLARQYLGYDIIRKQGVFNPDEVEHLKKQYCQDGFTLAGAYEIDYLQIIMTVTILCDTYGLTI